LAAPLIGPSRPPKQYAAIGILQTTGPLPPIFSQMTAMGDGVLSQTVSGEGVAPTATSQFLGTHWRWIGGRVSFQASRPPSKPPSVPALIRRQMSAILRCHARRLRPQIISSGPPRLELRRTLMRIGSRRVGNWLCIRYLQWHASPSAIMHEPSTYPGRREATRQLLIGPPPLASGAHPSC
jgi:hypothetical protein